MKMKGVSKLGAQTRFRIPIKTSAEVQREQVGVVILGRLKIENFPMPRESVVVSDPEILGGTPCFRGTRVPVDSLIDHLEAGDSLDDFLDNFPSVSREAAIAALEEAKSLLTGPR